MSEYTDFVWAEMYDFIGNEFGTAGLLGNLQAESGIIPYRLQDDFTTGYYKSINYTNNVNSGVISKNDFVHDGKGYGLAQWTFSSRKEALYDMWVSGSYSSIGDAQLAVDYLKYELQNSYSGVLSVLQSATSVREASDKVLHDFENPASQGPDVERERELLGLAIYAQYAGGVYPPPIPPDPPTPEQPSIPYWLLAKLSENNSTLHKL